MNKTFYRQFEDKYRGSREIIKRRLEVYLPFVLPFREIYQDVSAIDIGCGRGEWLELLKEYNIASKGVDIDDAMLQACIHLKLDVYKDDGLNYLKKQKNESASVVSSFHFIEHIPFDSLQELIREALRVLRPGGILILETPNPENIKVATEKFYMDPTHIKPIPAPLLSFLTEYHGFFRSKIVRLQEDESAHCSKGANLAQVFGGVSPDYAIVAQKYGSKTIITRFDEVYNKEFGISLDQMIEKFDERLRNIETGFFVRPLYKKIQKIFSEVILKFTKV